MFRKLIKIRFWIFFLTTTLFWSILFLLIWQNMLVLESDGLYAGWINVWGDWAAHLSYTTSLAIQDNFPPQFPILSGHVLSYPFFVDYLSSLFLKLGFDLIPSMLSVSYFLSIVLIVTLFNFFYTFTQNPKTASIAIFLFLFNGGLGFMWFIADFYEKGWRIFANIPREYTHLPELANIQWINLITSEFIPQRGFLLGLPIALFTLTIFWKITNGISVRNWQLILAGILTGLLPIIHMHSLTVLFGFTIWALVLSYKKFYLKNWLFFLIPSILLSISLIQIFYPQLGSQFISFNLGWLASDMNDNILLFWFKNAGIMLILPFLGFLYSAKKRLLWAIPFWGIFLLANLFIFQPHAWDNTKYFTYWWIGVSLFGAIFIEKMFSNKSIFIKLLGLAIFFIAIFSGVLDVTRVTQYNHQKIKLIDNKGLELSSWIINNTTNSAIFLTADNHDHPVPVLTGRSIVLGFPGWLWTYGIDTTERKLKIEKIYQGSQEAKKYLSLLGVEYILIGPWEKSIYKNINFDFFAINYQLVYSQEDISVFRVSP